MHHMLQITNPFVHWDSFGALKLAVLSIFVVFYRGTSENATIQRTFHDSYMYVDLKENRHERIFSCD